MKKYSVIIQYSRMSNNEGHIQQVDIFQKPEKKIDD